MHSTMHAVRDLSCCIRLIVKKHQGETPWTECHSPREIPVLRLTQSTSVCKWDTFLPPTSRTCHTWILLFFDTICNVSVSWHALASKYTLMSLFSCRFRRRGKKYLAYRKVWKILLGFCSRELNISLQIVKAKLKKIPYKSLASGHISKNTFCFLLLFCSFKKYKISHLFLSSKDVRGRSKSAVC